MTALALSTRASYLPSPMAGSLDSYIRSVGQIPLLTPESEKELAHRLHDENDLAAAQKLVLSNLRFVVHIARGYQGYGLPLPDLIQEGNIGLMKAVKRFDPNVGVRLISFAVHWVKAEIHEYILKNWRIVKIATTKAQRKLFFNLRRQKKHLGWMTKAEVDAVAKELNVKPEEVLQMESRLGGGDISFSATSSDGEDAYVPEDYLRSDDDPSRALEDGDFAEQREARMVSALETLDARSKDILRRRWLHEGSEKAGLQELGDEYGVSAERIRQIEVAAMKKLRKAIEQDVPEPA
jgi:RNA polymerase sigma-32 factor